MTAPLLRPKGVARILGVFRSPSYNLVCAGQFAAVRFRARPGKDGKDRLTIRISEKAVESFITQHTRDGWREAAG